MLFCDNTVTLNYVLCYHQLLRVKNAKSYNAGGFFFKKINQRCSLYITNKIS